MYSRNLQFTIICFVRCVFCDSRSFYQVCLPCTFLLWRLIFKEMYGCCCFFSVPRLKKKKQQIKFEERKWNKENEHFVPVRCIFMILVQFSHWFYERILLTYYLLSFFFFSLSRNGSNSISFCVRTFIIFLSLMIFRYVHLEIRKQKLSAWTFVSIAWMVPNISGCFFLSLALTLSLSFLNEILTFCFDTCMHNGFGLAANVHHI